LAFVSSSAGGVLDIDMSEVVALQRELRAVSADFAKAVSTELRDPVRDATNEFKAAARSELPSWVAADAASGIRATSSSRSGYAIKREANSRFTQHGYVDRYGKIRHPLYGNRAYWFDTEVGGSGWWSNTYERVVPEAQQKFAEALLRILNRLATGNLSTSRVSTGKRTRTILG
jgi:hypothetical protein